MSTRKLILRIFPHTDSSSPLLGIVPSEGPQLWSCASSRRLFCGSVGSSANTSNSIMSTPIESAVSNACIVLSGSSALALRCPIRTSGLLATVITVSGFRWQLTQLRRDITIGWMIYFSVYPGLVSVYMRPTRLALLTVHRFACRFFLPSALTN